MNTQKILFNFLLIIYLIIPSHSFSQKIVVTVETLNTQQDSIASIYFPQRIFESLAQLDIAIGNTTNKMEESGYFSHTIKLDKDYSTFSKRNLNFNSGPQSKQITIHINDSITKEFLHQKRIPINNDRLIINTEDARKLLTDLSEHEARHARPTTVFQLRNLKIVNDELSAILSVIRNSKPKATKVNIVGYPKFPISYTTHYLKINQRADKKYLNNISKNFHQLPFVTKTKDSDILITEESKTLYLYGQKAKSNSFEGYLGFGNINTSSKFGINGNLDLELLNNFNYGESLNLLYRGDGNDQQNLNLSTHFPFVFKSPITIEASLNLFRKDSTFSTSSQTIALQYGLNSKTQINITAGLEESTLLKLTANDLLSNYNKKEIGFGINYKTISDSESIFKSSFKLSGLQRNSSELQTKVNQIKFALDASVVTSNFKIHQFYFNSIIRALESKNYFENELFRFGGNKSIRGFKENQLLASTYFLIRTEYRFKPAQNLFVNTITDAAYTFSPDLENPLFLYSFGLGSGIQTKSGLLLINIANGISKNTPIQFSNTIIHIGISTEF